MAVKTQESCLAVNMGQEMLQLVEKSNQLAEAALQQLAEEKARPQLWVADWGSTPLRTVELQETPQVIVLTVALPQVSAEDLTIEIGAETVLIQALQSDTAIVEGYAQFSFSPGHFKFVIPLPCRVHPELLQAELHAGVLELTLAKSGTIQRQGFRFKLTESCPIARPAVPASV
jgi:HSP20 family molecular chaperone IbpA